jgi:hypothetical protein
MGELHLDPRSSIIVSDRLSYLSYMLDWKPASRFLAIATLTIILYRVYFHPFAGIPGPQLAAITGLWRSYYYARGSWHDDILELHSKYGRVVRIAPNEVSVVDATAAKRLFGHGKGARKTTW